MSNKATRSKAGVLQGTLDLIVLQTLDSLGRIAGIIDSLLHGEA